MCSGRARAGTYPSHQRCCAASASHSGETKGEASPLHVQRASTGFDIITWRTVFLRMPRLPLLLLFSGLPVYLIPRRVLGVLLAGWPVLLACVPVVLPAALFPNEAADLPVTGYLSGGESCQVPQ